METAGAVWVNVNFLNVYAYRVEYYDQIDHGAVTAFKSEDCSYAAGTFFASGDVN